MNGKGYGRLCAAAIGLSALLLFLVQPIMAKLLLPRFGGAAGVWVAAMLFFQVVLLAGYRYAYGLTRGLGRRAQGLVHAAVVLASLAALPNRNEGGPAGSSPLASVLFSLTALVGLPYFVLSTTGPLLQSWYAGSGPARFPYRLFALSNAASLAALLAYPALVEPLLTLRRQIEWWSIAYLVFAALVIAAAFASNQSVAEVRGTGAYGWRPLEWVALAACPAVMWLAVGNHLSQEVAAIPFLWLLPLSLYLLSFILCFEWPWFYQRTVFRWLLPAAWAGMALRNPLERWLPGLGWDLGIFAVGLFICAMFCHGELAAGKPDPRSGLAAFYLYLALGGALGAALVAVIAPRVFSGYLELPIAVAACALLAGWKLYRLSRAHLLRLIALAALTFVAASRFQTPGRDVVRLRNFYGALEVSDTGEGADAARVLYNGRTLHGIQFLAPERRRQPTAFYAPESGVGLALAAYGPGPRRIGVIGLGAGTLASYGRPGDQFLFYEINPAVIGVAWQQFGFLRESAAAVDVREEDGRMGMVVGPAHSFDAIVLDAFSDDSIPIHLLTREAFEAYLLDLRAGGVLAVHVTNRYLDLAPVVKAHADALGWKFWLIHNDAAPDRRVLPADWAVLAQHDDANFDRAAAGSPIVPPPTAREWTDDFSNLFQTLR